MDSEIKITYHRRLFLMLLVFTWTMVLSFIGFQYYREKQYRSEILNAQMQVYNKQLIGTIENRILKFQNSQALFLRLPRFQTM